MILKNRIDSERTGARGNDQIKYDVLTMVKAKIEVAEKKDGILLDDAGVEAIIRKEIKELNETMDVITKKTSSLTSKQAAEVATSSAKIDYLETFVPKLMGEEQINIVIFNAINELGISPSELNTSHRGRIMGKVMPLLKGKADGKLVATLIEGYLSQK